MKTVVVECKFVIEVPWDEKEEYSTDEHIRFCIEENSCPGTNVVGSALGSLMEVADKNSICWACMVGGENRILSIEDREPRNYSDEIEFKIEKSSGPCRVCGKSVAITIRKNSRIIEKHFSCENCGLSSHSSEGTL